jgi:hypothetical protein
MRDRQTRVRVDDVVPASTACFSTAVFVLGHERALELLPTSPCPMRFVVVDSHMAVHVSPNMRDQLVMHTQLDGNKLPPSPADVATR